MSLHPVRERVAWNMRSGQTIIDVIVTTGCCMFLLTLVVLAVGCAVPGQSRQNCGNNIKQLALGLQNYHDTFLYLPYGSRNRSVVGAAGASWGSSWLVATLPFCEQRPLFDAMVEADNAAPANDYQSAAVCKVADGKQLKYLVCQGSPLPPTQQFNGSKIVVPSYAGIMGSSLSTSRSKETRVSDGPYGGKATAGGMLLVNEALTFAACTDGTAFEIIVGEVSNWYYDDKGAKRNLALSIADAGDGAKKTAGWFAGNDLPMTSLGQGEIIPPTKIGPDSIFNLVSVAHPVNTNNRSGTGDTAPNWGTEGVGRCGLNNPLSSAHGAGAMVGFLDGHVVFLSNNTNPEVLYMLSCRDDGGALPKDF